ncbi:hypothetical protein Hanom_Chr10g00893771 [Helianthus anomalus]
MEIRYLGEMSILVTFGSQMVTTEFLKNYNKQWGECPVMKNYGRKIRINMKELHGFVSMVVEVGEVSKEDGNLSIAHIGVVVNTGQLVNTEIEVKYKETTFKCWISDVLGSWSPNFVNDESVFVNIPVENIVDDEFETRTNEGDGLDGGRENSGIRKGKEDNRVSGNSQVDGDEENISVNGEEEDTSVDEGGENGPVNGGGATENTMGLENESPKGEEETVNADINFGGNWRKIFAECMRNEKTANIPSPRNSTDPNNKEDTGGANRVIMFRATNRDSSRPNDNGLIGDNGDTVDSRRLIHRQAGSKNGLNDDPFNLDEIIWASN